jgi:hypothetical protein
LTFPSCIHLSGNETLYDDTVTAMLGLDNDPMYDNTFVMKLVNEMGLLGDAGGNHHHDDQHGRRTLPAVGAKSSSTQDSDPLQRKLPARLRKLAKRKLLKAKETAAALAGKTDKPQRESSKALPTSKKPSPSRSSKDLLSAPTSSSTSLSTQRRRRLDNHPADDVEISDVQCDKDCAYEEIVTSKFDFAKDVALPDGQMLSKFTPVLDCKGTTYTNIQLYNQLLLDCKSGPEVGIEEFRTNLMRR